MKILDFGKCVRATEEIEDSCKQYTSYNLTICKRLSEGNTFVLLELLIFLILNLMLLFFCNCQCREAGFAPSGSRVHLLTG